MCPAQNFFSHCDGIDEPRELIAVSHTHLSTKLVPNQHSAVCSRRILVPAPLTKMLMLSTLRGPWNQGPN